MSTNLGGYLPAKKYFCAIGRVEVANKQNRKVI